MISENKGFSFLPGESFQAVAQAGKTDMEPGSLLKLDRWSRNAHNHQTTERAQMPVNR